MILHLFLWIRNEHFCGDDAIQVSTANRNGMNYLSVPIFVEPINDPPFIHLPEFIILKNSKEEGSLVFDREQDKFEFSVGDPDLLFIPGMFSILTLLLSLFGSTYAPWKNYIANVEC